jgi:serine/threonine-protein kinase
MSHIQSSCQFIERVGAGAFGEVWKVQQSRGEDLQFRTAALKVSYQAMGSEEVSHAFDGLRLALSLELPGLIQIFEIDEVFGRLGVLMELADCTLWQLCIKRPLPVIDLVRHIRDVSTTLDVLAADGIAHAGITPEEMLVCGDQVRLTDFSLMHRVGSPVSQHHRINLFTWACMSPEMRMGSPTLRSDQYSLAASYVALRKHKNVLPNPMANEPICLESLSNSEREVIARALAQNPETRFVTCAEFARSLETAVGEVESGSGAVG